MRVQSSLPTGGLDGLRLSQQQKAVATELRRTDQQVRAHEQAHLAAADGYANGGPSFTFTKGPDGQLYATAGEVPIDASPVGGDPEATIRKAETIRAAAQAPSDPSSQDRMVAAQAGQMEIQAQQELSRLQQETGNKYSTSTPPVPGALISLIG